MVEDVIPDLGACAFDRAAEQEPPSGGCPQHPDVCNSDSGNILNALTSPEAVLAEGIIALTFDAMRAVDLTEIELAVIEIDICRCVRPPSLVIEPDRHVAAAG